MNWEKVKERRYSQTTSSVYDRGRCNEHFRVTTAKHEKYLSLVYATGTNTKHSTKHTHARHRNMCVPTSSCDISCMPLFSLLFIFFFLLLYYQSLLLFLLALRFYFSYFLKFIFQCILSQLVPLIFPLLSLYYFFSLLFIIIFFQAYHQSLS